MADNLPFNPGGAGDPLIGTTERSDASHAGHVRLDLGVGTAKDIQVGSVKVRIAGAPNMFTTQIDVGSASPGTQVLAARPTRRYAIITNMGAIEVFLGNSGVTATTGTLIAAVAGTGVPVEFTGAIFCRTTTGTVRVSAVEYYD